jgi:hypothetical protein
VFASRLVVCLDVVPFLFHARVPSRTERSTWRCQFARAIERKSNLENKFEQTSNLRQNFRKILLVSQQVIVRDGLLTRAKNSQASNWDFDRKRSEYFSSTAGVSSFKITTMVIKEKAWDLATLEKHHKAALERLAEIWDLDLEGWDELEIPQTE